MSSQKQLLLGFFFLTALSILGVATFTLGDVSLFGETHELRVRFTEANGLRKGDPVTVMGMRHGKVLEIFYDPSTADAYKIRATLRLTDELDLMQGAQIVIKETTMLGGRQVDILPGEFGGAPYLPAEDGYYLGLVEPNPLKALGSIGDIVSNNANGLTNIVGNLEAIIDHARSGRGTIGRFLMDETMAQELANSIAAFNRSAQNISSLTDTLVRGEGFLGYLWQDEGLVENVQRTVGGVADIVSEIRAGKGLAGALIYDDQLSLEVERAITSFRSFGERMESGQGLLSRMMVDRELADSVEQAIENVRAASANLNLVLAKVQSGEGTVGKLVMQDELYNRLDSMLKLATRSLEDVREAAPVTTFASVLFSAF